MFGEDIGKRSVKTTYKLLRAAPHVVQRAIAHEPWMDSPAYKELCLNDLKREQLAVRNAKLKQEVQLLKSLQERE
jgi:hypothetical protein